MSSPNHSLDLQLVDYLTLDQKSLYFFAQEQQYYFLNKLQFDETKASAEYVRYRKFDSATIIPEDPEEIFVRIVWSADGTNTPKIGYDTSVMIQISEIFGTSLDYLILGKCHDVLDAAHLKENIQHLIEDLEHFQAKL